MQKLDGKSLDLVGVNRAKLVEALKEKFPEIVSENEVDLDMLALLLGKDEQGDPSKLERYNFTWAGKRQAAKLALTPSMGTLRPAQKESVNWDSSENLYIEGDNLEVLKLLQKSYFGKVKMIYIDPPYNTGKEFVYPDDYADNIQNYLELTQQINEHGRRITTNAETSGRYHTNWLNMMYPRLKLARNLLRDDGVIFISIDDNEVANLRKICDEIFGEENFVAQLVWERAYAPKNDAKFISNSHDYVLMIAKQIDEFKIGRLQRTEEANARYSNPDNDPRGVWKASDMSVKTYNAASDYPITTPSGRIVEPPAARCWRLSKNAFFERLKDNRIWFGPNGDSVPSIKRFLSELKFDGMAPTSILFYKEVGHSQEGAKEVIHLLEGEGHFDGPKPTRLLNRLLRLANTDKNDIILDFFSGSATTAHAVMQLNKEDGGNRKFIMVQLPELTDEKSEAFKAGYKNICEIGKERIRCVIKKIEAEQIAKEKDVEGELNLDDKPEIKSLDLGFKVFKLDTSNFHAWDMNPDNFDDASLQKNLSNIKLGRLQQDLLYELFIKLGVTLNTPYQKVKLGGKNMYDIGSGIIYACLDEDLDMDFCKDLLEYHNTQFPKDDEENAKDKKEAKELKKYRLETTTFIFRDTSFKNDQIKTNILQTLRQQGLENIKAI